MPRRGGRPSRQYLEDTKRMQEKRKLREVGMLTGGQAKIAAKAPPTNKIDEKDFAVLRAEKAKGRGKGLQDEKVKPGKVMKAKEGKLTFDEKLKMQEKGLTNKKTGKLHPAHEDVFKRLKTKDVKRMTKTGRNPELGPGKGSPETKLEARSFLERRKKLSGRLRLPGRLGAVGAAVAATAVGAKKLMDKIKEKKKKKADKKMGGGLAAATAKLKAQGLNKGGGADTGKVGEMKSRIGVLTNKLKRRQGMRLTKRALDILKSSKKMGGGMMKRPMSYNKGGGADYMNTVKAKKRGNPAVVGKVKNLEKRMGGGMMQKPMPLMGYKTGKMIMARGCKLGRKKATKIT